MPLSGNRDYKFIITIEPSETLTNRGNPIYWEYLLECGHVYLENHSFNHEINYLTLKAQDELRLENKRVVPLKKRCKKCASGRTNTFSTLPSEHHMSLLSDKVKSKIKKSIDKQRKEMKIKLEKAEKRRAKRRS